MTLRTQKTLALAVAVLMVCASNAAAELATVDAARSGSMNTTPRELLVRLTDGREVGDSSGLVEAGRHWRVVSASRVVRPVPGAHPLRAAIERTWVLRFERDIDLRAARADYEAIPLVEWAAPNILYRTLQAPIVPNDAEYGNMWNLPAIAMPRAWAIERGDPSVIVAVVDTGTTLDHPDLQGQLWQNPGEIPNNGIDDDGNGFVDDIHGWDFVDAPTAAGRGDFTEQDPDPTDETGHGTHVSGILSARPDNEIDIAGVAWNCRLMPVRAGFAASGGGTFLQEDDSSVGIIYAVENGASVINMSWGDERGSRLLRDTLRYAHAMGVVLVGATGNENHASVLYPAAFPEVISVAASARDTGAAYFTNATADVDLTAPGVSILSLHIGGRLRTLSGTSMAAPHVAGVAALMLSKRPALRVDEVKRLLIASASALVDEGRAVGVPLLNAANALAASESLVAEIAGPPLGLGANERLDVVGSVGGPGYAGYRLSYGETSTPTAWEPLVDRRGAMAAGFNGALYTWDTSALPEAVYTLRLEAYSTSGDFVRDQRTVHVDHSPPRALRHEFFHALTGGHGAPSLWMEFDDVVSGSLVVRDPATGAVHDATDFATPQRHFIVGLDDVAQGGSWSYTFVARNFAGMETTVNGTASGNREFANPGARVLQAGNRLPAVDVAPTLADFNGNGLPEIVGSSPGVEGFVFTQVFEAREGGQLRSVHQFREFFRPLDVGDLDGDGLFEVLAETGDDLTLLEAPAVGEFPSNVIWTGERMKNGRLMDADGDGSVELLATMGGSTLAIIRAVGDNAFEEAASLRNATDGLNFLTPSRVVADIDGDGREEIVVGDADGNLVAFRWDGAGLSQVWDTRTRFREIHDIATGVFLGKRSIVVLGEESFGLTPRGGAMATVAVYTWDADADGLRLHDTPRRPIRRFRQRDDRSALAAGPMDSSGDDTIAVISGGHVYLLRMEASGALALDWADRADPTKSPVFLDTDGDGRPSLFYNERGFLNRLTPEPAPTRPFALAVSALSSSAVRLTWRWPSEQSGREATVYRAVGDDDDFSALATVGADAEYVDGTVREGERYSYEVRVGDGASDPVGVFVGEQPRLLSAAALTASRVSLTFSLPMGRSARQASVYRLVARGDEARAWTPTSVARQAHPEGVTLAFSEPLPAGDYVVEVVRSLDVRSDDDMPVDVSALSAPLHVQARGARPTDLSQLRVYPNPVYPSRNHTARVEFGRIPAGAEARVYTPDGRLIAEGVADERDAWTWDLLNTSFRPVAAGVYAFVVEWDGRRRVGKLAVIR